MQSKRYSIPHRRTREGKTNYKTRLKLLKGDTPRLTVRKSLKHISIQAVEYKPAGDIIKMTVRSSELVKLGWKHSTGNTPAAYLTGLLAGKKLKELKISNLILDVGQQTTTKGARIFAALKGVIDAGIKIPFNEEIVPDESRLTGKHIADHGKVKNASSIVADFEALKSKING